ncbi:hypothetical protein [Microbulbifer magnicolonia]|uniref:hypothetical protein n=1 Tax=Microbulbifer magnicolonia TaxID=3109744 RepID=UPI002B41784C|nr:hypothetical protein [Microbulbifer sp. GG15]
MLRERWLVREMQGYGKSKGPLSPTLAALANDYLIERYHAVIGSSSYRPGFYQKTHTGALVTEQGLARLAAEFGPAKAV